MARERDKAHRGLQEARNIAAIRGATTARGRRPRRAAPRVAGEESGGAEQRDIDARGDRCDGAARDGQANDRRGRARACPIGQRLAEANRLVMSGSASRPSWRRRSSRRATRSRPTKKSSSRSSATARKDREAKAAHVPRACSRSTIAFGRASESTRFFRFAKQLVRKLRHDLPLQRRSLMSNTGVTEICEGCGVMLYAAD